MTEERIATWLRSLERPEREIVEEIEQEALACSVPVIRKETQSFLKTLICIQKPQRVLEIGTAVGFSAILMCEYLPEHARVTTMEYDEKRVKAARENIRRAGYEDRICLLAGDALEIMPTLTQTYELIFMDAAKAQYIRYLPEALRLLSPGGVLVTDNVLQGGDVLESRFAVERRNRTIHSRMREYLYELKHREGLQTAILPLGDGVALSVRTDLPADGQRKDNG